MYYPGQIQSIYQYSPRFPYGQDGTVKVISLPAIENIPLGVMLQAHNGGARVARDGSNLLGVSVYDPQRYSQSHIYSQYDVVPILRRGSVYVSFVPAKGYINPTALGAAYVQANTGAFTTDATGIAVRQAVFSVNALPYYPSGFNYPQKDIQDPPPPIPFGATETTFGAGVALVDLNLG